jgi:pimeloyl-ACP methyl ester carboxylesterase
LLRIGAAAGWRTIAVDRPGYGESAHAAERGLTLVDQARLVGEAVQDMVAGLPTVVVAHSFGTLVALELAVAGVLPIAGVALCGMPLLYTDAQRQGMLEIDASGTWMKRNRSGTPRSPDHWYGPSGTWDERVVEYRRNLVAPNPSIEFDEARRAPELLPALLRAVDVPIQLAEAEFESTTAPGPDVIEAAHRWVRAPLETVLVEGSGHNVSLNSAAAQYHRRVVAFADRVR